MAAETIKKIEKKIKDNSELEPNKKIELLELMGKLKLELQQLQKTDSCKALTIAELTGASTQNALKDQPGSEVTSGHPLKDLETSVEEFEVSHPELVRIINRICIMLSSIGI